MTDTKYSVPDGHWDDDPEPEPELERTRVSDHEIDVIFVTDPGADMGYGREKYTATIRYDDETGEPYVLFAVEHRWKGNYWRDVTDWDWRDVPEPVRRQIAAVLPVDSPDDLDDGVRVIGEGGECRWEKYHKPRMEATSGEEMWAGSSLRDAVRSLESAAEQLAETGTETGDRIEELIDDVRDVHGDLGGEGDES
ncbi:hypothetical protein [Natrarchaeobius oligotrophus]|uniref:Uncharacterized protein n=1 Tax=Natrarchaeobius chitinivorans TaxID=1679083 RepID=A0A3N6LU39_NATCH|nr:hypothetical protein [Natrarchaeobius chitinivorans]RQG93713.1 hypothetical protein EA472_22520 [Natrarchaeobius chitinivorans]